MGRIIIKVVFLLSISLNLVLGYHILSTPSDKNPDQSLALTMEQESRLQVIHNEMNRSNEKLKTDIADCQKRLVEMLKGEQIDKDKITNCINMISSLQKKLQHNTIEEILKIKGVLNRKQCKCFLENLDKIVKKKCDAHCPHRTLIKKDQP